MTIIIHMKTTRNQIQMTIPQAQGLRSPRIVSCWRAADTNNPPCQIKNPIKTQSQVPKRSLNERRMRTNNLNEMLSRKIKFF